MSIDLASHLPNANLKTKVVPTCLRGDLMTALWEAEEALAAFVPPAKTDKRLGDPDPRAPLQEAVEAAREAVRGASLPFRVQALPSDAWDILVSEHPPRKEADGKPDDRDLYLGYNADTFGPALVRRCLIDPVVTDEQWAQLAAVLDAGQMEALEESAFHVNKKRNQVPFSSAGSARPGASVETSKPQSV